MRRVYFLHDENETERTLDAILAQGLDPEQIENPTCPLCGEATIPAYLEDDGDFTVVTWDELELDEACVEAWYLVCQEISCPYEEQVERTLDPEDATFFELHASSWEIEEEICLQRENPAAQKELIAGLKQAVKRFPYRRNQDYLETAEWCYRDNMKRIRRWTAHRRMGEWMQVYVEPEHLRGRFFAATENALMMHVSPDGHLVTIPFDHINHGTYRLLTPDQIEREERPAEIRDQRDNWIMCTGSPERVVIRGYHLHLEHVDRFGIYHVRCWERGAAVALGLIPRAVNYWEGAFRRSEIEARYTKREMIQVKGHWVMASGETAVNKRRSCSTEDPVIAEALGFERVQWWREKDEGLVLDADPPLWQGYVHPDQIEAYDEVRIYQWPIPEAHRSETDAQGDRR